MKSFSRKLRTGRHARSALIRGVASSIFILWGGLIAGHAESRELVIGRVSSEPQRAVARIEKLAQYLALRSADLGITKGRTIVVPNNAEMSRLLLSGGVDLFSDNVVAAASFSDKGEAEILLHEWRDHVPYYHSLFVTLKDSKIHGLSDLLNRKVAVDNVGSTTAYLLPMALLRGAGLEPAQISNFNAQVPTKKVGYVFSGRAVNTASWVARGVVDAGAVSNIDMEKESEIPESISKELRILTTGIPLPRSLLLARGNLDSTLRNRIVDTLLAADRDSAGRSMLRDYFDVDRYTLFQGEVVDRFRAVRQLIHKSNP